MWSRAEELSSPVLSMGHGATCQICQLVDTCWWCWGGRQQSLLPGQMPLAPAALPRQDRWEAAQDPALPSHSRCSLRGFFAFTEQGWVWGWCRGALEWLEQQECSAPAATGHEPCSPLYSSVSVLSKCNPRARAAGHGLLFSHHLAFTMKALGLHHTPGSPGVTAQPPTGKNKSAPATTESERTDRIIKAGIGMILFHFLWEIQGKRNCS